MFKKIGKYLLSAALVFTSVFAVAGCGKDDDNGPKSWEISKDEWETTIDSNAFSMVYGSREGANPDLVYNNGVFYGSMTDYDTFFKTIDGNNVNYYETYSQGREWLEPIAITENEYKETNIDAYLAIIKFADANYDKFEKVGDEWTGFHVYSSSKVKSDIPESSALGDFEIKVGKFLLVDGSGNKQLQIRLVYDSKVDIIYFDGKAVDYVVKCYIDSLVESYTLENNSGDVNQIKIEVDNTGFHVVAQSGEEYLKDNGDGTYIAYVKNGESFVSHNYNDDYIYETEYKKYVTAHTLDWSSLSLSNFKIVDGKYVYNENVDVTDTGTKYEYHFSNIMITLNANNQIEKMTWDYKVHDKSINEDSPVYQITLTPGTTITYPTVG